METNDADDVSVLHELVCLADGLDAESIASAVLAEVGRRVADALGCMLGGAATEPGQMAYDAVGTPTGEATLVAGPLRSSVAGATLANTTAQRSLDFMDGHPGPYSCHPSLLIPAVLAAAEARDIRGLDVARAIVLGYELDTRLQLASGDPDITLRGWSGSTNLALATSFGVGSLLGLRGRHLVDAMSIATIHAPTLDASSRGQMAQSKAAVDGMVAMSAVAAVHLAAAGMTGPHDAYDGEGGFVAAVAGRYDPNILFAPLNRFRILDCYTKVYNAVKCAQSAAAAALELRSQIGNLNEITDVTLHLAERDWRNQLKDAAHRRRPTNRDTANHSVVYCLAAALVEGDLQAREFEQHYLTDHRILTLIDKTTISGDRQLTRHWPRANPARVEIRLASGATLAKTVLYPPGHPRNPVTTAQLAAKVGQLTANNGHDADALVDAALQLATLPSVRPLMNLLVATNRDR
jgi:2-methylcitrate dehydratase